MDYLSTVLDFILHLDTHLGAILERVGAWSYLLFFAIIFAETGLVVTPFLPGDSLLFALGAFAAKGSLNIAWLFAILSIAAIAGDSVNYAIGKYLGARLLKKGTSRLIKQEHLDRTHQFYEKYGAKTIVLARFVPIVRTFAPFVAGLGRMTYARFFAYNVIGGLVWIALFLAGGYFFGNLEVVKKNFTLVILAIIVVSMLPGIIEILRQRRANAKA